LPSLIKIITVQIDPTTLHDLSFLQGARPVFALINRCTTQAGTERLRNMVRMPPATFTQLKEQQDAVRFWMDHLAGWTNIISNGTIVMIEKFYETADVALEKPNAFSLLMNAFMQKAFNKNAYSFVRFSIAHLIDFFKGCQALTGLLEQHPPQVIKENLEALETALKQPLVQLLLQTDPEGSQKTLLQLSYRARRELKQVVRKMIGQYAVLDALRALALATAEQGWTLPELLPSEDLVFHAQRFYHPLLKKPVAYDIDFSKAHSFLFLTGANMSGKSTLIRALGINALLAHIGCGVPAKFLRISFLEGIITNIQVADNIFSGESYFFAEVERMKLTAEKLRRSRFHLVLMDELFKGTNVHDAYECSKAVIEGLLRQEGNLMALSTHLNELSDDLKSRPDIFFRYCQTDISADGSYHFSYQLKEGVSQDRIGFLVLKNEGVLDLLR
jgi:DNA mismatch repair ATPase MutS